MRAAALTRASQTSHSLEGAEPTYNPGAMPSSYRGALAYLVATGTRGIKPGLELITALLGELGTPQAGLRGALVAGTNGKGSTCAMVDSACRAAGLRSVLLVKPHLRSYRERVVLDGVPISAERFAALIDEIRPAAERVEASIGQPTQFDVLTALGVLAARDHRPEVVVCEVGLGGRLDSTNVLDLGVAIITGVALDHQDRLGTTVGEIAAEKAGIIKAGDDVVTAATGEALDVVRARAAEVGAGPLTVVGENIRVEARSLGLDGVEADLSGAVEASLRIPLPGLYQATNAAVAAAACAALTRHGVTVPADALAAGLATVSWPGRLQWLPGEPPLLLDGGHNPAAIDAIAPAVREICAGRPLVVLFAAMFDKDVAGMLERLRSLGAPPVFTHAGTPRSVPAVELARLWGAGARAISALPDALAAARMLAGHEGVVLACGSLYLVGDILQLLGGSGEI